MFSCMLCIRAILSPSEIHRFTVPMSVLTALSSHMLSSNFHPWHIQQHGRLFPATPAHACWPWSPVCVMEGRGRWSGSYGPSQGLFPASPLLPFCKANHFPEPHTHLLPPQHSSSHSKRNTLHQELMRLMTPQGLLPFQAFVSRDAARQGLMVTGSRAAGMTSSAARDGAQKRSHCRVSQPPIPL